MRIKELEKQLISNVEKLTSMQKDIIDMQLRNTGKEKKGQRFTKSQKALSLSLYKVSPKAYRFLRKIIICPSIRSLRRFMCNLTLHTGINGNLMTHLKSEVENFDSDQKLTEMMWDEMSLMPHVSYDAQRDLILGFEDFGSKRTSKFADHILVFMIRTLKTGEKKPFSYYFCNSGTRWEQLVVCIKENVKAVKGTGLELILTICDQRTSNVKAIKELQHQYKEQCLRNNVNIGKFDFESIFIKL